MNKKVLWITRTASFVALLVVLQFATSFLNNTMITGSIVNLILIISVSPENLPSAFGYEGRENYWHNRNKKCSLV